MFHRTVKSRYLKVDGTFLYKFKLPEVQRQIMVRESNQNVFLIQIDASIFAEFEISDFEISRVDCSIQDLSSCRMKVRMHSKYDKWSINN